MLKINIIYTTICFLQLFVCTFLYAQEPTRPLFFDHLTINEGLSHNTVYSVLQDSDGYIWVGTQNGLNKYDGYTFEQFNSSNKVTDNQGFKGKRITALFEDSAKNIWVGTAKNGLNFRKAGTDKFVNLQTEAAFFAIAEYEITAITEAIDGTIWIGTVGAGVLKYDPQTKSSEHFTTDNCGLTDNIVFDIKQDKYGTIWAGVAGVGINVLQENEEFTQAIDPKYGQANMAGYHKKIYADDDYFWIGTEGTGLYRMDLKTRNYTHFSTNTDSNKLTSDGVRDVIKGADGRIYIATDGGGLNVYDQTTDEMQYYTHKASEINALNSNALVYFWRDKTDNIWIGTFNGGLNIIKNNKTWFEFYTSALGGETDLGNRSVLSVFQSKNGIIWIGTDGGGLHKLTQKDGVFSFSVLKNDPNNSNSLGGNIVKSIYEDSQNRLVIGIFGKGLDVYDLEKETFQHIPIANNLIWSITEGKDGHYWIGTLDKGLVKVDLATGELTNFEHYSDNANSVISGGVMAVLADKKDRIWAGTGDNGLILWDEKQQQFTHHTHQPGEISSLSNNEVRAIFEDSQGQIWIGTEGGGLNRWLGNGQFARITEANGLIGNSVMGITEDQEGYLWVTTFLGLSRYNPKDGLIQNFNFHTKENSNQFNQIAVLTATDGKLYFGGVNGLNAIYPAQVKDKSTSAHILFTDLKIFNKSIPVGKLEDKRTILPVPIEQATDIYLDYSDNSFSIEFAAIDFTNPTENTFSYLMEGFDNNWQSTTKGQHRAHYTNLDPGTFTFKVKYQGKITALNVHIQPPFWKTIWFRLLSAIGIAMVILGGTYFYIQRKEEIHRQEILEAERKILQLKNENLHIEVNTKNSKLMSSSAQMAHKNEIFTKIKKELKTVEKEADISLRRLINSIDHELKNEDYWTEFDNYVNQVDKNFSQSLLIKHPKLTQNDLRLCTLLRMNLSTKEIAALLNISVRGVEKSRYRLKKRLDLTSEQNLINYIFLFK